MCFFRMEKDLGVGCERKMFFSVFVKEVRKLRNGKNESGISDTIQDLANVGVLVVFVKSPPRNVYYRRR